MDKPKTNYLNLIIISLAFVLFLTGVFLLGRQSVKTTEISTITPITNPVVDLSQTTAITTPLPIVNYNGKYINTDFGFNFDYPKNYSLTENSPTNNSETLYLSLMSPVDLTNRKGYSMQGNELKVEIWVSPNTANQTLEEYFAKQLKSIEDDPSGIGGKVISTNGLTIGGYPAKYLEWQGNGTGITYYLFYKNNIITIAKYPAETLLQSDFNQILSTFKFIDMAELAYQQTAMYLVSQLPEVINYRKTVPNTIIEYDHDTDDKSAWVIHVYEIKDDHTATFNWFDVDKKTQKITKEFDF